MTQKRTLLPSVELQTVEFLEVASEAARGRTAQLRYHGFRVSLEYQPELSIPGVGTFKDILVVSDVYVPPRYRRRGWFMTYLKLCWLLVDEALFVDGVYGPVREALIAYGFEVVLEDVLMMRRSPDRGR